MAVDTSQPSVQVHRPLLWTLLSHCCCHWWMNSWRPWLEFSWLITMPWAFDHFYTLLSTRLLYMTQFFTLEASHWMFSYCLITYFYHSMASLHWLINVNWTRLLLWYLLPKWALVSIFIHCIVCSTCFKIFLVPSDYYTSFGKLWHGSQLMGNLRVFYGNFPLFWRVMFELLNQKELYWRAIPTETEQSKASEQTKQ